MVRNVTKGIPENRPLKDHLFRLLGMLLLLASFAAAWLVMEFDSFRSGPLSTRSDEVSLLVRPGSSFKSVASELHERGVLKHPTYLVLLARWLEVDDDIKAGEYAFSAGISPEQLLERLTEGQVLQYALTLIEGEPFRDMMQRIANAPVLEQTLSSQKGEVVMQAIGYPGLHPEGRFLPETYHYPRGTSDVDLLRRAFRDMEVYLDNEWTKRDTSTPLKTPYEALILASIVEKETGQATERPQIAGVFTRRLRKGMRLQTDPTVIYGIGEQFDGDIRFRDLRKDTPYNTYTRGGLPPTPIAMPGKDAIRAALHPAAGDSLYFVARGDGSHQFSATLKAHNRAVDKYQRNKR
ncbi:FIG004453: protein YceG like [hydrothermal vent metagenome]|uniref:FIG004453: protein YceG like n=1 Tax=hydrothermal vent metagenome TaxID=652676 RepID=A0A3B0YFL8_9ZZZZ